MKHALFALAALLVVASLLASGSRATSKSPLRVGYVTWAGSVPSNRTLDGMMLVGFLRAEKKLGVQGRVVFISPNQDPTGALRALARQQYDLIIAGFPDPEAVDRVAIKFPHARFFLADFPYQALKHRPRNVQGSVYRAEEASYLAGYLAALMERRRPGKDVISAVGGYPFEGVTRWIIGYRAGARRADPGIAVRTQYSMNFSNPSKCRKVAQTQIAQGSGVVFNVAGYCGLGALQAAKAAGVWGVGVDADQSFLGRHILTSAVIRLDRSVFDTIRKLQRGRFTTGGNTFFDLRHGGVGLGKISGRVPLAYRQRVDSVRRAIVAGRIRVPHLPIR